MRQIKPFSDVRLENLCSYCGGRPDTRDHVPSKILLDEPFPDNLPVVPCCNECNQSFSLDEEYIACFLECVICGSTTIQNLRREKIRTILENKPSLREKIQQSMIFQNRQKFFKIEEKRLKNIALKLAKGHSKYENSEIQFDEPRHFAYKTLNSMSKMEIDVFLAESTLIKAPEIGSRAMQNLYINSDNDLITHWIKVQPNIYEYCITQTLGGLSVKIIIWNYLAIELVW